MYIIKFCFILFVSQFVFLKCSNPKFGIFHFLILAVLTLCPADYNNSTVWGWTLYFMLPTENRRSATAWWGQSGSTATVTRQHHSGYSGRLPTRLHLDDNMLVMSN